MLVTVVLSIGYLPFCHFEPYHTYNAIDNQYNTGKEASGQFSIPDYRGYFLRMVDLGTGKDPVSGLWIQLS